RTLQAGVGKFAQMAAEQAAVRTVEEGGGQRGRTDLLRQFAMAVKQDVVQMQTLAREESRDLARAFCLIDEEERYVRIGLLRSLQHGHLAPAGRAPRGPEVDDQRSAPIVAQEHWLTGGIAQGQVRESGHHQPEHKKTEQLAFRIDALSAPADPAHHGRQRQGDEQ
nr:hypothetical protein [Tanacetum cinerariifolium]